MTLLAGHGAGAVVVHHHLHHHRPRGRQRAVRQDGRLHGGAVQVQTNIGSNAKARAESWRLLIYAELPRLRPKQLVLAV